MAEQRELFPTGTLWENPTVHGTAGMSTAVAPPKVGDSHVAPALVVEDGGNVVRLYVEGAPAPKYGPGLGRKPRRGR